VLFGDSCFKGCTALKKEQLPSSGGQLDDRCFEDFEGCTSLSKVDWLGGGPVQISKGCFRGGCALATVVVPKGVRELDTGAFEVCASQRSADLCCVGWRRPSDSGCWGVQGQQGPA
jgi:hypothetical protein